MPDYSAKFEEAGKLFFEAENAPITSVYIDVEYMQDFMIGALLGGIEVPAELEYVTIRMPKYNTRYLRSVANCFPVLKLTDEILRERMKSMRPETLVNIAPFTTVYYDFIRILTMASLHNKNTCDVMPSIRVVLNVVDVAYPEVFRLAIQKDIMSKCPTAQVLFTTDARYMASADWYTGFDVLFLYDYGKLVADECTTMVPFVSKGAFVSKRVIAQPYIDPTLKHLPDEYDFVIESTEAGMNLYCDFIFLPSIIPVRR